MMEEAMSMGLLGALVVIAMTLFGVFLQLERIARLLERPDRLLSSSDQTNLFLEVRALRLFLRDLWGSLQSKLNTPPKEK